MFMKRKIISSTYLRDVDKYQIKIFLDEDDYYVSIKKLIKVKEKFIIKNNICVMDDNYYVVEYVPKYENYAMRIFLDDKKNPLEYYFDISLKNGLDEESKIPYYDDLYTDITVTNKNIEVLDEEELREALDSGKISKEQYDLANLTKDNLLKSIKEKNNKYMNLNLESYLK